MSSNDLLRAAYDETPYRDQVLAHLDLSRLLGFARLFSLGPQCADPSGLRVLDLGCSSGARREAIRELCSFRVGNVEDPAERVRESALLLRLLHAGYSAHENYLSAN